MTSHRVTGIRYLMIAALTMAIDWQPVEATEQLRVFILAGQSNMEGQGGVDLDHPKYLKMLSEVDEALKAIPNEFPQLAALRPEISGFVWFQGWNDMFDEKARAEYQQNLVNLIGDALGKTMV